jgi:multidrug efflux pump subunit AcrA (membrane-fusion protein)
MDDLVLFLDPDREFRQGHTVVLTRDRRVYHGASGSAGRRRPIKKELDALRIDRSGGERRRPTRWIWWLVVPLVIFAAAAAVWRLGPGAAIPVRTVSATEQSTVTGPVDTTVLNASGYVTARRRATVASKITGRLIEVRVEEGLPVRSGEVLARLEDAQLRATLDLAASQLEAAQRSIRQTEAQLGLARLTLDRTRRLVEAGVADAERLDQDETEVETLEARIDVERQQVVVAERELALRRTQLDDTVILAPFDGIVISKDAQPGEMVSPNSAGGGFTRTGICTIVDMNSL